MSTEFDGGGALPEVLQACFVVESECFAWWGVRNPGTAAAEAGLPEGAETRLPLALPERAGRAVVATEVPAVLVDAESAVAALANWSSSTTAGESLRAWSRIAAAMRDGESVETLIDELPTAGHAALCLDGATIWSGRAAVDAVRHGITGGDATDDADPADPVEAALRPYQRAGVAWLRAAATHGGGVLADEMGLGKTVQAIAVLARRPGPHLVVCPTSVLGNWARELDRFAPGIDVAFRTGSARNEGLDGLTTESVVLTSYGVLRGDADVLAKVGWDVIVLDEAQQIKNPDTRAARAARKLNARLRVAMTGTPVENRLDELWSLLAFTNPGLLGPRARFRRRFAAAVEQRRSEAAARRLHEIVGPHVLRRHKSDVAPELPAKIESTVVCELTAEQERLYRTSLEEVLDSGLGSGIERRGRVLTLLTRLKHICNHPELAHPTGGHLGGRSGKLDRVTEMLAEIVDSGERALVFTQYRETGELLAAHLGEEVTGRTVPFLHGGLSTTVREEMINRFQLDPDGPPMLLLSLRAAGFGLNLTRATHVVHYDRWWNPAVEDQASDRAHRIGQTRAVTVHTLCTERSVEEAIADLHAGKRDLSGIAVGRTRTVETDLARLGDDQLRALLELDR
ncbi:SNF2 family DNA or RNA helicase [Saccharopolyspora lacisalsi]|uniref:SNF2 family DNA or RNA helicase n=1 Tax=Halosaccharopolyspora lacisalsi TaxID=1000566 RepID=A0A839DSH6_9PSEU|nr:DEAD/DEAH box helicase [Halosaccharopolyspora lacisalsi]MBA8824464.1 SNF2 family DNA or RNA helicase [Halosaccharopolyspora lacisalsi]